MGFLFWKKENFSVKSTIIPLQPSPSAACEWYLLQMKPETPDLSYSPARALFIEFFVCEPDSCNTEQLHSLLFKAN